LIISTSQTVARKLRKKGSSPRQLNDDDDAWGNSRREVENPLPPLSPLLQILPQTSPHELNLVSFTEG
jgi:hypothetical protein